MAVKRATYEKLRKQLTKILTEVRELEAGRRDKLSRAAICDSESAIARSAPGYGIDLDEEYNKMEAIADIAFFMGSKQILGNLALGDSREWISFAIRAGTEFNKEYGKTDWGQCEETYIEMIYDFFKDRLERSGLLEA